MSSAAPIEEYLEATTDCVFLLDEDWRFTFLNNRARCEIAGGRTLVGCVLWDAFPQGRGTAFERHYVRAMDERRPASFEAYFEPLSSWYEVNVSPLSSGGIGVWFRNINERKTAEAHHRAVEERYRLAARATNDLVWDWDLTTDTVQWTEALEERLGYKEHQLGTCAEWWLSRVHPDDRPRLSQEIDDTIAGRRDRFTSEYRFRRANDDYARMFDRGYVMRDADGRPVRFVGAMQDLSERAAAEDALASQTNLLQNVVDSIVDLIFVKDRTGRFILANRAVDEGCGALVGLRTTDLFPASFTDAYEDVDQQVMDSGQLKTVEELIPVRGEPRLFQTTKVPWIRDGEISGVIGVSHDITERKAAETALRESETLHRSVLEASADCIKIVGVDGRLQLMNAPGARLLELDNFETIKGREWASLWPPSAQETVRMAVRDAAAGRISRFSDYCPTARGQPRWWDVVVTPMLDEQGSVTRILSISRDVTVQRKTAEQLKWASEHDSLTSLPNRRAFQAHLQASTLRAMESGGMVGLLLMDLDHFKHVNDTLGHAAGDHLLQAVGKRLTESVRSQDFLARLGGDEFAIILEGVEHEKDLLHAGESILKRLQAPIRFNGRMMSAGASIGGALFPRDATSAHDLFDNADTALYALKEDGRGGIKMFHHHLREEAQAIASQLSLGRIAVAENAVVPHYQPKVDLQTGRTVGFEALMRWRHSRKGLQTPDTIAEAFKDYELASRIGELMQERVFEDVRRWLQQGVSVGSIAINAAPAEFLRDDFAERLLARLEAHRIPSRLVEIEVTEHVFLDRGSDYVARALKLLHAAGVRIALDDFGTGYSSLSHLRDFPVDVVKIDRSFVAKMIDEPEIGAIVSAVIDLAASLKIQVVAEGVETEDQKRVLREKGCRVGQGFLFGAAAEAGHVAGACSTRRRAATPRSPRHDLN